MSRPGPVLVSLLEIGPGSTHGEGEFGAGIGESTGFEFGVVVTLRTSGVSLTRNLRT